MNRFVVMALLVASSAGIPALAQDDKNLVNRMNEPGETWASYSSGSIQSAVQNVADLPADFSAGSAFGEDASAFGFAARSPEARMFLAGSLFAEALALTQGGQYDAAVNRLESLREIVVEAGAANSTRAYLRRTASLISTRAHDQAALVEFVQLLQPMLDDLAVSRSEDMQILFQTGAWLVDLSVAAAAGDPRYLQQTMRIEFTISEMERMDAPRGVLDGLRTIAEIAGRESFGSRDANQISREVRRIQQLLG